jgi:hypothetical protein
MGVDRTAGLVLSELFTADDPVLDQASDRPFRDLFPVAVDDTGEFFVAHLHLGGRAHVACRGAVCEVDEHG